MRDTVASTIVTLNVNNQDVEFLAKPGTTLLTALREHLGLTAAKRGCAQGTSMASPPNAATAPPAC